ncbi:MAG: hypothetical protein ACREB9_04815 [Thermoplasmata archaeon]
MMPYPEGNERAILDRLNARGKALVRELRAEQRRLQAESHEIQELQVKYQDEYRRKTTAYMERKSRYDRRRQELAYVQARVNGFRARYLYAGPPATGAK